MHLIKLFWYSIWSFTCLTYFFLDYVYYAFDDFQPIENEGMKLYKGERIHVIDWNEDDWWFATKVSSGVSGWVPAHYLIDEDSYVEQDTIENRVSLLPVSDGKNRRLNS